jgi:transglutaminase-like putative cysteine protease
MSTAQTVNEVVERVVDVTANEREKAIAIHDYVRENVKFGFNKYFDAAEPDYTLACGVGHCNAKGRLMVALFQATGLESYQHFVVIPKDILIDAFPPSRRWMLPAELSHAYVEVKVEGAWCAIDSYSVDTPLLKAAQARLAQEGRSLGYGTRVDATNVWDGRSNAFSQFEQGMVVEDHGRIDDLEAYFRDRTYRNHMFGMRFNTISRLMGDFYLPAINTHIERIRMVTEAPIPLASIHK